MAEISRAITAITEIVEVIGKSTVELNSFIRNYRSVPREIKLFARETTSFTDIANYFNLTAEKAIGWDDRRKEDREQLIYNIRDECEVVQERLLELVDRFREINHHDTSSIRIFWARIVWIFEKPDVDSTRLCLLNAKGSISCVTNFFLLEEERQKGDSQLM